MKSYRRYVVCNIDGCDKIHHARGWCRAHYTRWRRFGDPLGFKPRNPRKAADEPWICTCPVSYPAPKCCTVCGYPNVHRMAPHIRDRAFAKMPRLRDQLVLGLERRAS